VIVVDASLACKWLFPERQSAAALAFLQTYRGQLAAPDLLLSEVGAAIVRQANTDKALAPVMSTTAEDWIANWRAGLVAAHRIDPELLEFAVNAAIALGHPLADCVYLALAERLGCDLATCDVRFRDRAVMRYPRVRLLEDYVS
jgi:predicted nucleic acid-binding protein